jgi:hypothetical protein
MKAKRTALRCETPGTIIYVDLDLGSAFRVSGVGKSSYLEFTPLENDGRPLGSLGSHEGWNEINLLDGNLPERHSLWQLKRALHIMEDIDFLRRA